MRNIVRDTVSESLLDFLQKSQTPVQVLWSLRSIDPMVIAFHPSFVNLRMPQNASLVLLISEPNRVNICDLQKGKSKNKISFNAQRAGLLEQVDWKTLDKIIARESNIMVFKSFH